jgi:hypothetical protein
MNDDKDTLTITVTGNLTVARADLEPLMRRLLAGSPAPAPVTGPEPRWLHRLHECTDEFFN